VTVVWSHRQWALVVAVLLVVIVVLVMSRPAQPPVPRVVDEHGNNLVYQCPGDPRCDPTPSPR
jgi:hypothetical protein